MSPKTRFVEVPADDLLSELNLIGQKIEGRGGQFTEGVQGREVVYDFYPHTPSGEHVSVRVYTTLTRGADVARDCGEDAIRIVVGATHGHDRRGRPRFHTLAEPRKILRTAPKEGDRVRTFLDRLVAAIREAYVIAAKAPTCPSCTLPMVERQGKNGSFYGCIGYPDCRKTMSKC